MSKTEKILEQLQDELIVEKLDYLKKLLCNIKKEAFNIFDDDEDTNVDLNKILKKIKKDFNFLKGDKK